MKAAEVKLTYKSKQRASERPKVLSSKDCYGILLNCFDEDTIEYREYFKVLLLNRSNRVLGIYNLAEGGISEVQVDVRMVMQAAILSNASGIILAHNHPSGEKEPSLEDKKLTKKVEEACNLMGFRLLEHLIITPESYYSFVDEGIL
jgi:DNA repair protein RadC